MQKRYAVLGFSKITDDGLATLGLTIVTAMTANPSFETPVPALADVQVLVDDFQGKLASAYKGSPLITSEKNNSRETLEGELKKLAFYVNTVADGELHIVLSSGFPVKQLPSPIHVPAVPERLQLVDTQQSGQLRFNFNRVKHAWEYEYNYTAEVDENGEPLWGDTLTTTSSRGNVIAPLQPGSICHVRVRSRNGKGLSDWSESINLMAR